MVASLALATSLLLLCFIVPCVSMDIFDDFAVVQPKTHVFSLVISCRVDRSQRPSKMKETAPDGKNINSRSMVGRLGCHNNRSCYIVVSFICLGALTLCLLNSA